MSVIHVSANTFQEEVLNSSTPVLVDFFATQCGPCKMLSPVLEEIAKEHEEIKVCKIDIDEEQELTRQFGIMSVPTLLAVKDGKAVRQMVGVQSKNAILSLF